MKRTTKLLALALALVLALGLAGCGTKTASMTDSYYSERISSAPMEEPRPDTPMESESMPSASAPGGFGNFAAEDGGTGKKVPAYRKKERKNPLLLPI